MNPLTPPLPALIVPARAWVRRHLLPLLLGAGLLVGLGLGGYRYYAGQLAALRQNGAAPLKARQVRQLQRDAELLAKQQAQSQHRADSTYAKSQAPERDAARRQVIIHQLTTRYHALATDSIRPAAAAATTYLQHYAPGPDAAL